MTANRLLFLVPLLLLLPLVTRLSASDIDEFKVKRQEIFEFTDKPKVTRDGDKVTISFASKAFCDATVAIEDSTGRVIRHLACGVLGPNAPPPFQKNSLNQSVVWDSKDDQEVYVDDRDNVVVRVSLGLKPQFERTLFWSPKKRIGFNYPSLCAAPEGVYMSEGAGIDHVSLFDHQGNYLRTVYPFPADKIDKVQGLKLHTFAQDGKSLPLKRGYLQSTLLTTGTNGRDDPAYEGCAVEAMAAVNGQLALVNLSINRLAADGSSAGLPFDRPQSVCFGPKEYTYKPRSAAFSPDGKWLYLAGYHHHAAWTDRTEWMNGVFRVPYGDGNDNTPPTLFVGDAKPGIANGGTADGKFRGVTSVACDARGRVYVGDYMNDRIQVFDADGKHLKSIPVTRPAYVAVHQKTGDIYSFSWMLVNKMFTKEEDAVASTMTHLGPLDNPTVKAKCPAPIPVGNNNSCWNWSAGLQGRVVLDTWAEKPTVWIVKGDSGAIARHDDGSFMAVNASWDASCVSILEENDGKLTPKREFAPEIVKSVARLAPPILWRQRLTVNPATGRVYVLEGDSGVMKSVNQVVEIAPDTGKIKLVDLPLGAEDLCFDVNGLAYIRTDTVVARYDPRTWREVPWDYGEELENHSWGMSARGANLVSALRTPGGRSFNFWHLGGIDVSLKGHLAVTTGNYVGLWDAAKYRPGKGVAPEGKPYVPAVYPGRARWGEIHVFDKHGRAIVTDAVPGMGHLNGIGIDQDDNIYMLSASRRIINGKPLDPGLGRDASGTVLKVPPGKAKVLSSSGYISVPMTPETQPKRSQDIAGYTSGWVEGAEWFYGGIGFSTPGGCVCWNCRFTKDYFNRSFAPETMHYSVAVIDSAGNLILRVGKYGNVDDGKPLAPDGGPPTTRSIGGDEVGLFYACYVATHTDRRLFIADAGNARILSVALGYHATEKVALKDVPDSGKR